jgi:hypothetical protein
MANPTATTATPAMASATKKAINQAKNLKIFDTQLDDFGCCF